MSNENTVEQKGTKGGKEVTDLEKALSSTELVQLKTEMENQLHTFLVPLAMSAYETLLTSENEAVQKNTADAIMELAGYSKKDTKSTQNNAMSFVMPPNMFGNVLKGIEKVVSGEEQDV